MHLFSLSLPAVPLLPRARARLPTAQCAHTIWHLTTAFEEMHFDSRLRQICCQALETSRIKPPLPSTDMKCVCGCAGDGAQKCQQNPDTKLNEYGFNVQQQYLSAGDDERLSELVCHLQSVMDRVSLLAICKANGARGKLKEPF